MFSILPIYLQTSTNAPLVLTCAMATPRAKIQLVLSDAPVNLASLEMDLLATVTAIYSMTC